MNNPTVIALLNAQKLDPSPSTPAELGAYMKSEYETWGKVIKQSGIKAE